MYKRVVLILVFSWFTVIAFNQQRNIDFYLNEAVRNSPLLNDYRNQVNSSVTDSMLVAASHKPLVEARSQLLYSPYYHNFGYDDVVTDGGNYTAVVGVSQNILNRKVMKNRYEAVDILKRSANNSSKISLTELKKVITEQYLTAYSDYSDFSFNKTFLDLFHKENEIVKAFMQNGVVKQTDYLSFLVESQTQELLVSQVKGQYIKDLMILNELCGLNDSSWYKLSDPQLQITGSPEIAKLPSYLQYKIDSIRIANEKVAIDLQYKPKISWFADAGFLTSNPWNFYRHFGYSAGLSLNIPIYDGKQKELSKQKLDFEENSRKGYDDNFRTKYSQQITQLELELKSLNDMSAQVSAQLKTSEQLVNALRDQLNAGIIQMTEYINAVKNYKTTSRNINLINIQKLQVINQMNFLLTGK
jgi:outer membrane protein TolC